MTRTVASGALGYSVGALSSALTNVTTTLDRGAFYRGAGGGCTYPVTRLFALHIISRATRSTMKAKHSVQTHVHVFSYLGHGGGFHISYLGTSINNASAVFTDVSMTNNRASSSVGFGGGAFVTIGDLDSTATGVHILFQNVSSVPYQSNLRTTTYAVKYQRSGSNSPVVGLARGSVSVSFGVCCLLYFALLALSCLRRSGTYTYLVLLQHCSPRSEHGSFCAVAEFDSGDSSWKCCWKLRGRGHCVRQSTRPNQQHFCPQQFLFPRKLCWSGRRRRILPSECKHDSGRPGAGKF